MEVCGCGWGHIVVNSGLALVPVILVIFIDVYLVQFDYGSC